MLKLKCPKCGSSYVVTTLEYRLCRRCGYQTEKKELFEIETKKAKTKE